MCKFLVDSKVTVVLGTPLPQGKKTDPFNAVPKQNLRA